MNLRSIDLNLLVALDALLDEAHVSRAAERLGLSQPAASQALERCRVLFRDPLLVRGRGLMRRTPKGEGLREPLKNVLAGAIQLVSPPAIDLMTEKRRVRITMADQSAMMILASLHQQLARSAPGIDVVVQPWRGGSQALDALARGDSDLAVSVFSTLDPALHRVELLQENYVVVMRKDHPALADFTLESWIASPHILVSALGETSSSLDMALAGMGLSRRVGMVVPSFLLVPPLIACSDMMAMLPSRCLPVLNASAYAVRPPPIAVGGFTLQLAWHQRIVADPLLRHVIEHIRMVFDGNGQDLLGV